MIQRANIVCSSIKMAMKLNVQGTISEAQKMPHIASRQEVEQVRTIQPIDALVVYREVPG